MHMFKNWSLEMKRGSENWAREKKRGVRKGENTVSFVCLKASFCKSQLSIHLCQEQYILLSDILWCVKFFIIAGDIKD